MPLLELEHAHVHYGGVKALDGASITLATGEVVALMGPNGAGKSTVLKAVFGLAPMAEGNMRWRGERVIPVPHEAVQRGISFVPQGRRVFPHLTAEENLEVGGFAVRGRSERERRMREVMEFFPVLKAKRKRKAGHFSGGEQQMLALARGLMTEPAALLLDEPSLGLAPKIVAEVFAKVKEISEQQGTAILVVEHNLASLLAIASRAYVLDKGKVVAEGDARRILASGVLERVLLGSAQRD